MAKKRVVVDVEKVEPVSVSLGAGHEYLVTPPKSTVAIALADRLKEAGQDPALLLAEMEGWIVKAFGRKQAEKVLDRLQDEEDGLDIQHIIQLMTKLAEAATGDPTM